MPEIRSVLFRPGPPRPRLPAFGLGGQRTRLSSRAVNRQGSSWASRVPGQLRDALDGALSIQRPAVVAHVERIRRRHPQAGAGDIVAQLEKHYLSAVSTLGAAAGGVAAVPGVGTSAAVALSVAEVGTFLEATAVFALAVAEVHEVPLADLDRRRTLILAVVLGNSGARVVEKAAGRTGAHWGRMLVSNIPMDKIRAVNRVLGRYFVTKYGAKQGILVLGRALPFGIGAVLGAGGNAALGYASVHAARRAFGPAPDAPLVTVTVSPPQTDRHAPAEQNQSPRVGRGPSLPDLSHLAAPSQCLEWVSAADPAEVINGHSVRVDLDRWNNDLRARGLPGGPLTGLSDQGDILDTGIAAISRGHVFTIASAATADEDPDAPLRVLWHALAWGTGTGNRNNRQRMDAIAERLDVARQALASAVNLAAENPGQAYRSLYPGNRPVIASLGPSFLTKYLYFAGGGRADHPCLILDSRVAASLVRAGWESLDPRGSWPAATYERYVELIARWRDELGDRTGRELRADLFERWLFDRGSRETLSSPPSDA